MAHPGMKPGDSYFEIPYNPTWQPIDSRQWAMKYIAEDRTENWMGFVEEFKKRHPFLTVNQVTAFIPATVDDYVRVDPRGVRQDIDTDLADIPLSDEEIELRAQIRRDATKERRLTALRLRGIAPPVVVAKNKGGRPKKDVPNVKAAEMLDRPSV